MAIADALILRLVFVDIAAMIAGDMQIGTRRRRSQKREQQHKRERDAHGSNEKPGRPVGYGKNGPLSGPDGTTLALLCWNLVKCPGEPKIPILRQIFRTLRA